MKNGAIHLIVSGALVRAAQASAVASLVALALLAAPAEARSRRSAVYNTDYAFAGAPASDYGVRPTTGYSSWRGRIMPTDVYRADYQPVAPLPASASLFAFAMWDRGFGPESRGYLMLMTWIDARAGEPQRTVVARYPLLERRDAPPARDVRRTGFVPLNRF